MKIDRVPFRAIRATATGRSASGPVNVRTHRHAVWRATVDWGTATAPTYVALRSTIHWTLSDGLAEASRAGPARLFPECAGGR